MPKNPNSPCCPEVASPPGRCRVYVLRGNVERNRLSGAPGGLPVFAVEYQGREYQGTEVRCPGPVVFRQDPTQTPSAWAETDWPVEVLCES